MNSRGEEKEIRTIPSIFIQRTANSMQSSITGEAAWREQSFMSLFPCNECAKAIIQCGIRTVVYDCDKYDGTPSVRASKRMMNAAGVRYYKYQKTGRNIEISV